MSFTPEQQAAIETRGVSVGLSSGAGCGKTFVLTNRLLAHLQEGGRLEELAAITFTERAAREMRDRIRGKIQEQVLAANTAQDRAKWQEHARDLETARISTIHAFCGSFLRAHAVEAGLDPNFTTLDPSQAEVLLATAVNDELRRQLADRSDDAIELIINFSLRVLIKMIRAVVENRGNADINTWRAASVEDVLDCWEVYYRDEFVPQQLRDFVESELVQSTRQLLSRHRSTNKVMEGRRQAILGLLVSLPTNSDVAADLNELHGEARVQGGGGAKAWPSPDVYEDIKNGLTAFRDATKKLREVGDFNRDDARSAAENGLRLLRVCVPTLAAYAAAKREMAALDFDDLLIHTRDLLNDPASGTLRQRTAAGLKLLLIDELQDTDPLQVELVKAMCDGQIFNGQIFVVGDYKQSIYRFRGADPGVFRQLLTELPESGRLSLTKSFRSQPAVLDFVNATFHGTFSPDYDALVPHRPQAAQGPCTEFVWHQQNADERPSASDVRLAEARLIAGRIKMMLEADEPLVVDRNSEGSAAPQLRPAREDDIALLFRALTDVRYYEQALREADVKYYLVGGHAFYAQQEIFDVLNILKAIASPDDDIATLGALRSPMFSLTDESLFWLVRAPGGLVESLSSQAKPPRHVDESQQQQIEFAARTLAELREMKDRLTISALLDEILCRTGYDAALVAEFLGERKLANVRKLVHQARSFQTAEDFTLDEFITRLAEFVASKPQEALAAIHPEAAGVVRLMTVHQAKGLEFPIVFVPDIDRREVSSRADSQIHPRLGPLVHQHKDERKKTATGLAMVSRLEQQEERNETARLFYVACTRAADYLVLSGSFESLEKPQGPWAKLLAEQFDLCSGHSVGALPEEWDVQTVRIWNPPEERAAPRRMRRHSLDTMVQDVRAAQSDIFPTLPASVPTVPVDFAAWREFSFSRISGALTERTQDDDASDAAENVVHRPEHETYAAEASADDQTAGARDQALALGTLVHEVLERIDFSKPGNARDEVNRQLDWRHDVTDGKFRDWLVSAAAPIIEEFLRSSCALQLRDAAALERELDFVLALPFAPTDEAGNRSKGQFLRGVIDVAYQDSAGAWHVLDYKTNQVSADGVPAAAKRYELQMFVYAQAIERILGQPPASSRLYFLRPQCEYAFEFSVDNNARLTSELAAAIDRMMRPFEQRGETRSPSANSDRSARHGSPPPPFNLRSEGRRRVTRKRS